MESEEIVIDFENSIGSWMGKIVKILECHLQELFNDYNVETDVEFITLMSYDDLIINAKEKNVILKQNEKTIAISEFNIKVNKANYFPKANLLGSYGWNTSNNPLTSAYLQITNFGLNAEINLLNTQTALNKAKYNAKLIELELLQLSGQILDIEF
jgi:outer membrane protein TolC